MLNLCELNKLESYLKDNGYVYERIDDGSLYDGDPGYHIIIVYDGIDAHGNFGNRLWDAAYNGLTGGNKSGLLEIYGNIVDQRKDGDVVVGHLTAADVIKRLNENG